MNATLRTPRLVIAAPASGSGKSVVATGLMAALAAAHTVQGFKVGPDYIDPGYHSAATGRISRNLDGWMLPKAEAKAVFARAAVDADVAIIEGVMGLFDGYEAKTERGSTAEMAKLLAAPVILVLDVGKMARSAGALALGYQRFDPDLNVAGVICNKVASPSHAQWVTEAVESVGLPVLGCLPRDPELHIPERHLGLHMVHERDRQVNAFLTRAAELIVRHVDMDRLWSLARSAPPLEGSPAIGRSSFVRPRVRMAVARDEAFCFYYEDNLDLLREAGVEIVFFSPLRDDALPPDIAGLYLGGGYPELYAARLAANRPMMDAVHAAHVAGMPIYAECGGLMVLTGSLTDLDGVSHPMLGILPGRAQMTGRLRMGYRQVRARGDTLLLAAGESCRGHEFHYSDWVERGGESDAAYDIPPRRPGDSVYAEGFARDNLLASYVHLHFGARPDLAPRLAERMVHWRKSRSGVLHR